jgi:hypothetical protein
MGTLLRTLTQEDIARTLADFRQAASERGIDLVISLALELKGERVRDVARRHRAVDSALRYRLPAPASQGAEGTMTMPPPSVGRRELEGLVAGS